MFPQALQESSGVSGVCFDKRPWGHVVSQSLFSTKKQSTEPPNLQRASSSLNLNPFPRKKNPLPSRDSLSKLWWGRGQWRSWCPCKDWLCHIQPAISLQFHPESAQKSLQRQSLSKSSYMDMNLGWGWAFCTFTHRGLSRCMPSKHSSSRFSLSRFPRNCFFADGCRTCSKPA